MTDKFTRREPLPALPAWEKLMRKRAPLAFDLELTARCNLNCRHCYINLPAGDRAAAEKELTLAEIEKLAGEAAALGAVWCLVTGGEPLLRPDFFDVYLALRKKGLLVSIYTNATLIKQEHIKFFEKYPPRDVEVTVYGVTEETYEKVTRVPGSFKTFRRGLDLLLSSRVEVRLKAMAMKSNVHELAETAAFCRQRTRDYFRFDPFLHYRFDRNSERNVEIESERLTPEEIVRIEKEDRERFETLVSHCDELFVSYENSVDCEHLFRCGAGKRNFVISHDGHLKICLSLVHPDFLYDLRKGTLKDAWENFVPAALERKSTRPCYLEKCARCPDINLCLWCPANAYLESGELDLPVDYFCRVARARAEVLKNIDKQS